MSKLLEYFVAGIFISLFWLFWQATVSRNSNPVDACVVKLLKETQDKILYSDLKNKCDKMCQDLELEGCQANIPFP
ncbi:hypothetical protein WKK05_41210 (plasmid) [Nostoc sp. UHCC 0302]|uniref:hypothetical protein n=1 Tax=Nostoc sp. UHCC 0302 TaxID=3134896 RepID=UPI00311CB805